jgi:hypothetical protein
MIYFGYVIVNTLIKLITNIIIITTIIMLSYTAVSLSAEERTIKFLPDDIILSFK